jgi:copper chaperone CopZ
MNKTWLVVFTLLAVGCGEAPPPVGPAAEATTPEVEVTIPDVTVSEPVADGTTLVSFKVPGMSCPQGCVAVVRSTLEQVPGVAKVDVNFDSKTATLNVHPDSFDAQVALAKLTSQDQFKETTLVVKK